MVDGSILTLTNRRYFLLLQTSLLSDTGWKLHINVHFELVVALVFHWQLPNEFVIHKA